MGNGQATRDLPTTRRLDRVRSHPLATLPGPVIGAKPAAVCRWIFDLLGAASGDTLDDLFPGSGAVTRAWAAYTTRTDPCACRPGVTPRRAGAGPGGHPGPRWLACTCQTARIRTAGPDRTVRKGSGQWLGPGRTHPNHRT